MRRLSPARYLYPAGFFVNLHTYQINFYHAPEVFYLFSRNKYSGFSGWISIFCENNLDIINLFRKVNTEIIFTIELRFSIFIHKKKRSMHIFHDIHRCFYSINVGNSLNILHIVLTRTCLDDKPVTVFQIYSFLINKYKIIQALPPNS